MSADLPCVGVAILVMRRAGNDHAFLYMRRSGGRFEGHWWPVAGTLEVGEEPRGCALRELAEETGLVPEALYATRCTAPHENGRGCLEVFAGVVAAGAEVRLNDEHDAYRWCSLQEARALTPPAAQPHLTEAARLAREAPRERRVFPAR